MKNTTILSTQNNGTQGLFRNLETNDTFQQELSDAEECLNDTFQQELSDAELESICGGLGRHYWGDPHTW